MSELLRTILIMSISGSIIAIMLFVLKLFIRNHLPKTVQYYLWLVVIVALLVPVSAFIKLPATIDNTPIISSPSNVVDRYVISAEEEKIRLSQNMQMYRDANHDEYMREVGKIQSPISSAVTIFMLVYPLGALIVLCYYIINYSIFMKLHRHRNTEANANEVALLAEQCGIRTIPKLYRNPLVATPMLVGIFRPAIILPDREYTNEQLRAVLLHESTHLRRKDVLVKWLSVSVAAIHWFNPIVWLVRHEIDRACELACDEAVIRNFDADGKQNYGETLLYVASDAKTPHAVISTTMCEEKEALKERLGAIMKSKKYTRLAIIASAVLLVAVGSTAIALGAGSREAIHNFNGIFVNDIGIDMKAVEGANIELYETGIERLTIFRAYAESEDDNYVIREAFDIKDISSIENFLGKGVSGTLNENQGLKYMRYTGVNGITATFIYVDGFDNGIENRLVKVVITPPTSDNSSPPRSLWSRLFTWSTSEETIPAENEISNANFSMLRTSYVGDNSAVGKIISILPSLGDNFTQKFFSIGDDYGTGKAPNTLTVYYEQNGETDGDFTITTQIPLTLFALIDNLEEVNIATSNSVGGSELDKSAYGIRYTYPKPEATDYIPDVGITWGDFQKNWEKSLEKLYAKDLMNNVRERENAWNLTLDEVRALSSKGDALQYSDLPFLRPSMLSSTMGGYNPTLYGVEGGYRLLINFNDTLNPESGIRSTALESIWESSGSGIDIRYDDVDEFIRTHHFYPADTVSSKAPEKTPLLDVNLVTVSMNGNSQTQISRDVRAVQLTNDWSVVDENGDGFEYNSDSFHPLQKQDGYEDVTLNLNNSGTVALMFSDNYPPQSVSIRRWNAEYAGTDSTDVWDKGEPVKVTGNTFQISDDGNDYIYEVYAKWNEGDSWYVFRIDSNSATWQKICLGTTIETVHELLGEPSGYTSGLWSEFYEIDRINTVQFHYRQNENNIGVVSLIFLNGSQIEP